MSRSLQTVLAACVVVTLLANRPHRGLEESMDIGHACCWTREGGTWKSETVGKYVEYSKKCEVVTQAHEKHGKDQCDDDNHAKTAKTIVETQKAEEEKQAKIGKAKAVFTTSSEEDKKNTEQALEKAHADADKEYNDALTAATAAATQTWKSEYDPKFQAASAEKEANLKESLANKNEELSKTMNEDTEAAENAYTEARKDIDPDLEKKYLKNKADCGNSKSCCCKQIGQETAIKVPKTFAFSQCDNVLPYAEGYFSSGKCNYYDECKQCVKKMCINSICADEGMPKKT